MSIDKIDWQAGYDKDMVGSSPGPEVGAAAAVAATADRMVAALQAAVEGQLKAHVTIRLDVLDSDVTRMTGQLGDMAAAIRAQGAVLEALARRLGEGPLLTHKPPPPSPPPPPPESPTGVSFSGWVTADDGDEGRGKADQGGQGGSHHGQRDHERFEIGGSGCGGGDGSVHGKNGGEDSACVCGGGGSSRAGGVDAGTFNAQAAREIDDKGVRDSNAERKRIKGRIKEAMAAAAALGRPGTAEAEGWAEWLFGICPPNGRAGKSGSRSALSVRAVHIYTTESVRSPCRLFRSINSSQTISG